MRKNGIDWDEIFNIVMVTVLIGFLALVVIGAVTAMKDFKNYNWCQSNYIYETAPEQVNLYAGSNDSELNGQWSIFGGNIETEDVVYYWINENGVKTRHDVPMSQASFIEDGQNKLLIFYPMCWEFPEHEIYSSHIKYEFHVPQDSVANMYRFQ